MSHNRTECGGGRHRRAFGGCNDEAKQWSRKERRRIDADAVDEELRLEAAREAAPAAEALTFDEAFLVDQLDRGQLL